jgi:1,4-dihydroxy-2-naphthoate polyprenyltransferase
VLHRSTIQLLRFHFSLFLLPVYAFALSQSPAINWGRAALVFVILHLLVYPSSNGYNSYMDRDQSPIGGLAAPMQPTRQLFYVSVAMDLLALLLSAMISWIFVLGILLYIGASRAYSWRGLRLKQFPVTGFLTVFIFQGALVFFITSHAVSPALTSGVAWLPCLLSSLLIGALYPLTQVYQHEEDKADQVVTISCLLGKRGTFVFSMLLFLSATALFFEYFRQQNRFNHFLVFLLFMLPVVLFFLFWMRKVWLDPAAASFKNSYTMNIIATVCTLAFFITLIVLNH